MCTLAKLRGLKSPYTIPGLLRDQFLDVRACVSQVIDHDGAIDQASIDVVSVIKTPAAAPDRTASVVCLHHGVCCQAAGEKQSIGPSTPPPTEEKTAHSKANTSSFFRPSDRSSSPWICALTPPLPQTWIWKNPRQNNRWDIVKGFLIQGNASSSQIALWRLGKARAGSWQPYWKEKALLFFWNCLEGTLV